MKIFLDSNIFHAKTFRIERVTCKIVKFATRVRKTTLSIPIPMEERISITCWQNIFLQSKTHFTHYLDIIQINGTLYGLLRHFADYLDTFQIIQILCTSSRYSSDHPDTFRIIQIFCRSFGHFLEHLDTFQISRIFKILFISSRHFSDHLDTLQIIWTPCRPSADFLCISSDYPQVPIPFRSFLVDTNNF